MDLTKNCALCGAMLPYLHGLDLKHQGDRQWLENMLQSDAKGEIDILAERCVCEGRGKPGECGCCCACNVERHGCGCDGAYDDGCFNCNPETYARPACPSPR